MSIERKEDWQNQIKRPRQIRMWTSKNDASEVREKVDMLSRAVSSLKERMKGARAPGKPLPAPIALAEQT